jgi:Putative Actinobacterial Holin-X, holin superfamily III
MTAHDTPPEELRERPIGDLVKQLASQTSTLGRQELDLAKAEMSQKASIAGKGAGLLGGAAVTGLLAAGALTACLILVLSEAMDAWLAALIVAVVMGAVAAALGLAGRNKVREATPPVPEQTVETVKEDVEWAKTRTPSART